MIGIDIIEVSRIKKGMLRFGPLFLNKLFTPNEQTYCQQFSLKEQRYAGRFAAKEAIAKVIQKKLTPFWLDIEILPDSTGAPQVTFSSRLIPYLKGPIAISISHERHYAVAVAQWQAP